MKKYFDTVIKPEVDKLDEILGKGKGDPDVYGYPGEVAIEGDTATVTIDEKPF